jgi:hypothetical protein
MTDQRPMTDERDRDLPEHETRSERTVGAGILSEAGTAGEPEEDATPRIDDDGFPAAAFDRRTMEAEGGEAERDDDTA